MSTEQFAGQLSTFVNEDNGEQILSLLVPEEYRSRALVVWQGMHLFIKEIDKEIAKDFPDEVYLKQLQDVLGMQVAELTAILSVCMRDTFEIPVH